MSKLYLQNIIDDISFENLPAKWQGFDLARFSKDKTLFDFQIDVLQNVLKDCGFSLKTPKESLWLPCHVALSPIDSGRITVDKREIKDCSKFRQVRISFIRRTLSEIVPYHNGG